jgi:hypothetical protein
MRNEPMLRCGEALVVYDGPRRLIWNQISTARWTPSRLWPDSSEIAAVGAAVSRGEPLLIILDRRPEPVHVLLGELAGAPPEITELVSSAEGEVAELQVPRLSWLPDHLAQRGQHFLQNVTAEIAPTPPLLLPALILQPPGTTADSVWFGLRVRSASWSVDEVMAVVDHMVAGRRHAA